MAQVDDQIKQVSADLAGVKADLATAQGGITGLQQQIAALNATIADLQKQLANAGLTADQQAALAQAVSDADALKTSADSLAATFAPPAPTPGS